MDIKLTLISLIGICFFCLVAWLSSENKKVIPWSLIISGLAVQFLFCLVFYFMPSLVSFFYLLGNIFDPLLTASDSGARFLFGSILVPKETANLSSLVNELTGELDIQKLINPRTNQIDGSRINMGYIFAVRSLPQIIFFSALFSLLYRLGLMQLIVKLFAKIFQFKVKLSGAETIVGFSNIFLSMESAVLVLPFLKKMTRSELVTIITCMLGSVSSSILAMYSGILRSVLPEATNHLMLASILSIPASFIMAKIIVPETETPETLAGISNEVESKKSWLASLLSGGFDGVKIAIGIFVALISILGLITILNSSFKSLFSFEETSLPNLLGLLIKQISIDNILGLLFFPFTFFTGISLDLGEIWRASFLIGQRVLQTSIVPYIGITQMYRDEMISNRGLMIVSYVLCSFAHIPALGIYIGGLVGFMPERMEEICSLALKSLWAATLATLMTGAFAGLFSFSL